LKRGEFDDWDIDDYTVYVSAHVDHSHKNGPTLVKALNEAHRRGEGPNYQMIRANVPGGIPRLLNRGGIYYFKGVPDKYYLEWGVDFKFSNNGRQITTPDLNTLSPKQLSPSTTPVFDRFKTMENFNNKVDDRYYTELERITARNAHKFRTIMQSLHFGSLPTSLFVDCTNETELRQVAGKHELMVQLCRPSMPLDDLEEFARRGTNKEVIHAIMYYRQDLRAIDITRFATDIDVFEDIWPNSRNKPVLKV
jgi:hypothetical protein